MAEPASRLPRMTAEEFVAWSMEQPEGKHYELFDGVVYDQASERSAHAIMKGEIFAELRSDVRRRALPCTVYPDGMAVRIDETTVLEPDCMVRCGPELPPDDVLVTDPVILVEVRSPSTASRDTGVKLQEYFRLPSLCHYLLFRIDKPTAVHYRRAADGRLDVRLVTRQPIPLDPPGLVLDRWWRED